MRRKKAKWGILVAIAAIVIWVLAMAYFRAGGIAESENKNEDRHEHTEHRH